MGWHVHTGSTCITACMLAIMRKRRGRTPRRPACRCRQSQPWMQERQHMQRDGIAMHRAHHLVDQWHACLHNSHPYHECTQHALCDYQRQDRPITRLNTAIASDRRLNTIVVSVCGAPPRAVSSVPVSTCMACIRLRNSRHYQRRNHTLAGAMTIAPFTISVCISLGVARVRV